MAENLSIGHLLAASRAPKCIIMYLSTACLLRYCVTVSRFSLDTIMELDEATFAPVSGEITSRFVSISFFWPPKNLFLSRTDPLSSRIDFCLLSQMLSRIERNLCAQKKQY